jgi:hypothetical protein
MSGATTPSASAKSRSARTGLRQVAQHDSIPPVRCGASLGVPQRGCGFLIGSLLVGAGIALFARVCRACHSLAGAVDKAAKAI